MRLVPGSPGEMVEKDDLVYPRARLIDRRHLRTLGLLEKWKRLFKKKHPWFRRRGYPHFDSATNYAAAQRIVTSPNQVASHSFYPFISFQVKTVKVKRNRSTGKVEKQIPKERPIAYASHVDSHIFAYYAFKLSKNYERIILQNSLQSCVIAFRALGKSNIQFAADAFNEIKKRGDCHVLCLDIKGFFDNLDHQILKSAWCETLVLPKLPNDHYAVFKALTRYSVVDRADLYELIGKSVHNFSSQSERLCAPDEFRNLIRKNKLIKTNSSKKGIPQGSPISALLSNIYMLNFDKKVKEFAELVGGCYLRYCDDMFLIVPLEQKEHAFKFVEQEIAKIGLEFQGKKTERVNFNMKNGELIADKPLQYLGFVFDGTQVLLRSASLARYSERMRRGVRLAKATMRKRNRARASRGEANQPLYKKKIFQRYTHLGRQNFLSYGYRAAKLMGSKSIKRQLGRLWVRVLEEMKN